MGSEFSSTKTAEPKWGRTSWHLWRSSMLVHAEWVISTGLTLRCCLRHLALSGWATTGPSPCPSIFISVVITEEIIAARRRSGTIEFIWKVDFAKSYDSLQWCFLWNVLKRRGFPEARINWMKKCVCTTSFAILVNRRPQGGWIHLQRGIK